MAYLSGWGPPCIIGAGLSGVSFGSCCSSPVSTISWYSKQRTSRAACADLSGLMGTYSTSGQAFVHPTSRGLRLHLQSHRSFGVPRIRARSKVLVEGTYVDYPLEYNLWQLPQEKCEPYLSALLGAADSCGEPHPRYASGHPAARQAHSGTVHVAVQLQNMGVSAAISTSIGYTKYRPSTSARSSRRVGRDVRRKARRRVTRASLSSKRRLSVQSSMRFALRSR